MQGSLRVAGGMRALIDGLAHDLLAQNILTGRAVTALSYSAGGVIAKHADGAIAARQVVLAVPPRVAAQTIRFAPELGDRAMDAARAIPTWMAGQAKIIAVYDAPHWRRAGLSGDDMSQQGPMVEIHDASPIDGGPYALFGFVGVPPDIRAHHHDQVIALALKQLQAMFGPDMAHPLSIRMMDWAQVPQVAALLDQAPSGHHPAYGLPLALCDLWGKVLIFGSTETAQDFGGYLEGALEAAERVYNRLKGGQAD
jgi:monoamine oxidase